MASAPATATELSRPPRLGPLYRGAVLRGLRPGGAGRELPDTALRVRDVAIDRAHLAEYARVCEFRQRDEVPATYPHILAFPLAMALMSRPDFPLPLLGLVHIANRVELLRPITADERLTLAVHAENLRPHDRGRQVDVVATATVGEEPVWSGRSTYLRRERRGGSNQPATTPERDRPAEREAPPAPNAVWRVERRVGAEYAAASGDRNPIHTSRLLARAFGFPRTIAHGMWSKARCLAALEGRLPAAYTVDVAFKLPILLPARVALHARPDSDTGWRFALHDARSGKPHLAGTVTAA